jgi:hypothetical protein
MANKIVDINPFSGGKASKANTRYLKADAAEYLSDYKPLRKPVLNLIPKVFKSVAIDKVAELVINQYKFRGLEFGNWVNQHRRIDFCLNLYTALYDLNKVLKFNNNIGINKTISIADGARGSKGALAHYEPVNNVINLSRDRRLDKVNSWGYNENYAQYIKTQKNFRENFSGYGSFSHEYGHALDYIMAEKYTTRSAALSGGRNVLTNPNYQTAYSNFIKALNTGSNSLEIKFRECFEPLLFRNGKPTSFYIGVYSLALVKKNTYWSRLNEIWARTFEVYVAYKLSKQGIVNKFLIKDGKGKYRDELSSESFSRAYPTYGEIAKVSKKIDAFIAEIAKKI